MDNKDLIAKNLLKLRTLKGLMQEELAEKATISVVAYRNIEAGKSAPKFDTIQKIAQVLEVNINDLLKPVKELQHVRFRAKTQITKRNQIIFSVTSWLENYNKLEKDLGKKQRYLFNDLHIKLKNSINKPQMAAKIVRDSLSIEDEPIRDICGLLEHKAGIKIYTKVFPTDSFFGLSVSPEDGGPAIVVNIWDRISVERRIFSTAHELGHLILHLNSFDINEEAEPLTEEKEADQFASYLLMPDNLFKKEWNNSSGFDFIERVFKIKKIFNVSYQAVLYRLNEHFPKEEVWKKFNYMYKIKYNKPLKRKEELRPLVLLLNKDPEPNPLLEGYFYCNSLSNLVKEAINKKLINYKDAKRILEIDEKQMKMLKESWKQELPLNLC